MEREAHMSDGGKDGIGPKPCNSLISEQLVEKVRGDTRVLEGLT